jgi:hypothetical protein
VNVSRYVHLQFSCLAECPRQLGVGRRAYFAPSDAFAKRLVRGSELDKRDVFCARGTTYRCQLGLAMKEDADKDEPLRAALGKALPNRGQVPLGQGPEIRRHWVNPIKLIGVDERVWYLDMLKLIRHLERGGRLADPRRPPDHKHFDHAGDCTRLCGQRCCCTRSNTRLREPSQHREVGRTYRRLTRG